MIQIRNYIPSDAPELWKLKHDTIHFVNSRDYSEEQVRAWAPDSIDPDKWQKRVDDMNPFIAEKEGIVVGFADLQDDGYVDHFFCHKDFQRKGVGRALMNHLINVAHTKNIERMYSSVSLTAKPFFEHCGFKVIKEQNVDIRGVILKNFQMEKNLI